jgi:hypothetical protein
MLETAYLVVSVLVYIVLAGRLLYRGRFAGWVVFSLFFYLAYVVGDFLFIGPLGFFISGRDVLEAVLYAGLFFGSPVAIGFGLARGMTVKQTAGVWLMVSFFLVLLCTGAAQLLYGSSLFLFDFEPWSRAWVELLSVLVAVLGLPAVIGVGLVRAMSLRAVFGSVMLFAVGMAGVMTLIYWTLGYEFLLQSI